MKQVRLTVWVLVCVVAVLICGCGKKDDDGKQAAPTEQGTSQSSQASKQPAAGAGATGDGAPTAAEMSDAATKQRETLKQLNQGKEIAAVAAGTLKGLLPETLAGMRRTSASAERNQMMGIDMSVAQAQYEGDNEATIDLTITDIGNMAGAAKMGMVGWTIAQYNRETDTGYEKTGTYNGHKGMEEYDNESKEGTIRVFVADRFVVEVNGSGITMDALKKALDQVDLKKVAALASGS